MHTERRWYPLRPRSAPGDRSRSFACPYGVRRLVLRALPALRCMLYRVDPIGDRSEIEVGLVGLGVGRYPFGFGEVYHRLPGQIWGVHEVYGGMDLHQGVHYVGVELASPLG